MANIRSIALVVLLAGCSASPTPGLSAASASPSDATASSAPPTERITPSGWDNEVADLQADGTRSRIRPCG